MKFSGEEERTVIELQGQFGNKWARIATYLSGRTDNDVKNFWSSRQKRLARILRTSQNNTTRTCASPLILEVLYYSSICLSFFLFDLEHGCFLYFCWALRLGKY